MAFKRTVNSFFHLFGYELRGYPPLRKPDKREGHLLKLFETSHIDLVLDIGAATGGYVEWIRTIGYNGRIISFEPLLESFTILQSKTNEVSNWQAVNFAVGDVAGKAVLNVAGNFDSSSLLPMLETHEKAAPYTTFTHQVDVQTIILDRFEHPWITGAKSIFLKLDVQGYERQVLNGAKNLFDKISGLQIEMSLVPLYSGQILFEEQVKIMAERGYSLFYVRPGFANPQSGRLLQMDGFFFKSK